MKRLLSLAVLFLSFALGGAVQASTVTGTLNISATVQYACTVATTAVDFGTVAPGSNVGANGDISVICTSGIPYHIALDAGQNYPANSLYRYLYMANATYNPPYILAKDSAGSQYWGDSDYANTFPNGSSLADTGNGAAQQHTVYGFTLVSITSNAGVYTDVVNVTVYY